MKFLFKKIKQKNKYNASEEASDKSDTPINTDVNLEEQTLFFKASYGGQCGVCSFAKLVTTSKDSHFIMCSHPQLPKYQGQPVLNCKFVAFKDKPIS